MKAGSSNNPVIKQSTARIAGAAYLGTIAAGMFAEAFARATIRVPSDALATAANITGSEALYRSAILADFVMLGCYAVVTALLYLLFKPVSRRVSAFAAVSSILGMALLAANTSLLLTPLLLLDQTSRLQGFSGVQLAELSYLVLRLHALTYSALGFFFGLYCLSIGYLAARSGYLPQAVGWLMGLAGATFLASSTLGIAAPAIARTIPDVVTLVSLIGEGALALWLTIFGIQTSGRTREFAHA